MGAAEGLIKTGLVLRRTLVAQRRVSTLSIVEHLDVLEQGPLSSLASRIILVVNQLRLERAEEAFHDGIVVTVALAAHAARQPMPFEQGLVIVAGVLNTPIAVMQ